MMRTESEIISEPRGKFIPQQLTKRFLMALPEGVYLVSSVADDEFRPLFEQYITKAGPAREMQWEAVKKAGADQRRCLVFRTKHDWIEFYPRIGSPRL